MASFLSCSCWLSFVCMIQFQKWKRQRHLRKSMIWTWHPRKRNFHKLDKFLLVLSKWSHLALQQLHWWLMRRHKSCLLRMHLGTLEEGGAREIRNRIPILILLRMVILLIVILLRIQIHNRGYSGVMLRSRLQVGGKRLERKNCRVPVRCKILRMIRFQVQVHIVELGRKT